MWQCCVSESAMSSIIVGEATFPKWRENLGEIPNMVVIFLENSYVKIFCIQWG